MRLSISSIHRRPRTNPPSAHGKANLKCFPFRFQERTRPNAFLAGRPSQRRVGIKPESHFERRANRQTPLISYVSLSERAMLSQRRHRQLERREPCQIASGGRRPRRRDGDDDVGVKIGISSNEGTSYPTTEKKNATSTQHRTIRGPPNAPTYPNLTPTAIPEDLQQPVDSSAALAPNSDSGVVPGRCPRIGRRRSLWLHPKQNKLRERKHDGRGLSRWATRAGM
uniref:Uncharacterized protein n=1 Tax=Mycena chlorophos TaxID=658473 RepID=A0ABQ0KVX5_MYCCL|nr:predicted protein [Mycena chlorophos]